MFEYRLFFVGVRDFLNLLGKGVCSSVLGITLYQLSLGKLYGLLASLPFLEFFLELCLESL